VSRPIVARQKLYLLTYIIEPEVDLLEICLVQQYEQTKKGPMLKLIPLLFVLLAYGLQAQSLVSEFPEKKSVLLEEFTGINCGWCPGGHQIAKELQNFYGDRFSIINVHSGPYSEPGGGQPDYSTDAGEELMLEMDVPGFPSGSLNRAPATLQNTWATATEALLNENSPINVGLQSTYSNDAIPSLTIDVETFTSQAITNARLVVAIIESNIEGPQEDYALEVTHSNYPHNHMLRSFLTGWDGEPLEGIEDVGSFSQHTFNYEIPESFASNLLSVVAYVLVDSSVVSAHTVAAKGGTSLVTARLTTQDPAYLKMPMNTATANVLEFSNLLGVDENYKLEWEETAHFDWNFSATVDGELVENGGSFFVAAGETAQIRLAISSHGKPDLAQMVTSFSSLSYPQAPIIKHFMYVASGARDLVVSNPVSADRGYIYTNGLSYAGNTINAETDIFTFNRFAQKGILDEIQNIYLNISWSFPSLLEETALLLKDFMDNGGNLLIAGQDIGWDQYSGHEASFGTATTQDFYDNYMHASYVDDGNLNNNLFVPISDDEVFGSLASSSIQDVDNGNLYPEFITPINQGVAFAEYGNLFGGQVQTCAIRAETENYKMVYLGFGLEQLANPSSANELMKLAHDWFYEGVEINEALAIEEQNDGLMIHQNYPNPAADFTIINFPIMNQKAHLQVLNIDGKILSNLPINVGESEIKLNLSLLNPGIYHYRLHTDDGRESPTLKLLVQ